MDRYNVIVLGGGSGGLTVAAGASALGARAALLEAHRMGGDCLNFDLFDRDAVPWTTFTQPEVARVGLSETDAAARGRAVEVFRAPFEDNDRAICDSDTEGFVKVITEDDQMRSRLRPGLKRLLHHLFQWLRR